MAKRKRSYSELLEQVKKPEEVRRNAHKEDDLQMACAKWFSLQYPDVVAYHVPNGGRRNPREGRRLKLMGVKRGIPDWVVDAPSGDYKGLRIELKVEGNKPTKEQKEVHAKLRKAGYAVFVCYSLEEFIYTCNFYFLQD